MCLPLSRGSFVDLPLSSVGTSRAEPRGALEAVAHHSDAQVTPWDSSTLSKLYIWYPSSSVCVCTQIGLSQKCEQVCVCVCVHSSLIHNSQKAETIQVFIERSTDKPNVVYTYNGLLFSIRRKNSDTYYTMDEN